MTHHVLVSVLGEDRVGVVSAITGRLYDLGADLGDTSFYVLGAGFEFTSVVGLPDDVSDRHVADELTQLAALKGAEVAVSPFQLAPVHGSSGRVTHHIRVAGGNRPGLVARLSEVFVEFGANIVRLTSERVAEQAGDRYLTAFEVAIPAGAEQRCLAAVANTARQLQMECTWRGVS